MQMTSEDVAALSTDCIFCWPDDEAVNTVLASDSYAYVRLDNHPLAPGHIEIVPVRHVASVFDLTGREITSLWELAWDMQRHPAIIWRPDGYTIGINDGPAAGQTIPHMHMHMIPRWLGDAPNPRGGIRNIFPNDAYSRSA